MSSFAMIPHLLDQADLFTVAKADSDETPVAATFNLKSVLKFRVGRDPEAFQKSIIVDGGAMDSVQLYTVMRPDFKLTLSMANRQAPPPFLAEPVLEVELDSPTQKAFAVDVRVVLTEDFASYEGRIDMPDVSVVSGKKKIAWTGWNKELAKFGEGSVFFAVVSLKIVASEVDEFDLIRRHEAINREAINRKRMSKKSLSSGSTSSSSFYTTNRNSSNSLISSLLAMEFECPRWSDCTVVFGEHSLPAHKFILCLRSPVFERKFAKEAAGFAESGVLDLTDVPGLDDIGALREFVRFLYTDDDSGVEKHALTLLSLAHMYQVRPLQLLCQDRLLSSLCVETAGEVLEKAILYSEEEDGNFKEKALRYVVFHFLECYVAGMCWEEVESEITRVAFTDPEVSWVLRAAKQI